MSQNKYKKPTVFRVVKSSAACFQTALKRELKKWNVKIFLCRRWLHAGEDEGYSYIRFTSSDEKTG